MSYRYLKGSFLLAFAPVLLSISNVHAEQCKGLPVVWRKPAEAGSTSTLRLTRRGSLAATSRQHITGGEGCISFSTPETRHDRMVGLARKQSPAKSEDFEAAFHLMKKGRLALMVNGQAVGAERRYKSGDSFTLQMENGTVEFYQNGRMISREQLSVSSPLAFGARLKNAGASVAKARISDPSCQSWTRSGRCTKRRNSPAPTPGTGTPAPNRTPSPNRTPTPRPTATTPPASPTATPVPPASRANAYFVSTSGSDSANGSAASPWRTVRYALSAAPQNSSISVRGGTYNEAIAVSRSHITLQSYPGELAKITSSTSNGTHTVVINPGITDVELRNLDISGSTYYAMKFESSFDNQSNPSGTGPSHVLVDSCVIHDSGSHAIKVSPESNYITFRNTEIHHSGLLGAANGLDAVNANWLTVQNCYIHDIQSGDAFFAKAGSAYTVIERTLVERASNGILLGQDSGPTFFNLQRNPNRYENMYGVARNNIVIDTKYTGIGSYSGIGVKLYNNTVINGSTVGQAGIYFAQNYSNVAGRDAEARGNIIHVGASRMGVRITANGLTNAPVMSNNLYFSGSGQVHFDDLRGGFNGTLSQWQSRIGGDAGSAEANPLLDAAGAPQAGSPAVDTGITISSFSDDFRGNQRPRGSAWDKGAIER